MSKRALKFEPFQMIIMPSFPERIDNSMRKEWVKCEQAAAYRYEQGLVAADEQRVDLHAGKAFARGLEVMRHSFYDAGKLPADALADGIAALYAEYGAFIPPVKSYKTAERMAGALAFYAQECPLDNEALKPMRLNNKLAVECFLSYPINLFHPDTGRELEYCGNFDLLAQDLDDKVWVVDEKTTSQMGEKWSNQWLLDSQLTGYCWLAQKWLDDQRAGLVVAGAVVNGIAIRLRDYEHGRFQAFRQQWQIDRWHWQMRRNVEDWIDAYKLQTHNRALDHACAFYNNPCQYAPLCNSRNPERLLDGSYVVKRWNPLTRGKS